MKNILAFLCFVTAFSQVANAQYNQQWFVAHHPAGAMLPTKAAKLHVAGDHLYVLATVQGNPVNDEDIMLIKYDMQGNLVWEKRYGVPGNFHEKAVDMAIDELGSIYITGESSLEGPASAHDFCTIKYTPEGTQVWVQRFGVKEHGESPCRIKVRNGMVFVTGKTNTAAGTSTTENVHSIIYNASTGKEVWSNSGNGPGGNWRTYAEDMTLDGGNNLVIVGRRGGGPNFDYSIMRYKWDTIPPKKPTDSIKIVLVFDWARSYNGTANDNDNAMFVTTNNAGDIYVTGESYSKEGRQDITTTKYDKLGNKLWDRLMNGTNNNIDLPIGIGLDSKENIIVGGTLQNVKPKPNQSKENFCTIKYNPEGDTLWTTAWRNIAGVTTKMQVMAIDKEDHIFTGGATIAPPVEPYVRKLNPDGQMVWETRIKNPDGTVLFGELYVMHIDQKGNLYFSGFNGVSRKMFLTKYSKQ
ncbi:MAG: hypothetical protein SFU87_13170 [Chitinophagaceae bacterium]|nr:hypothetical protein [Chitinophagaceae bacterium]